MRFPALLIYGSLIGRRKTLEFKIIPLSIFCFAHLPLWCTMFTIHCPWTSHRIWKPHILIQYRVIIIHLFHMKSRWSDDKTLCENYSELKHLMQLFINPIKMSLNFQFYLLRIISLYRAQSRLLGLVSNDGFYA